MIVAHSSAWISILADVPNRGAFETRLAEAEVIIVPTVVLYEVYKITKREHSEAMADSAAARLRTYRLANLTSPIALAADISLEHGLAMADSIVYATAQIHRATPVTGDVDFRELPGVEFIPLDEG